MDMEAYDINRKRETEQWLLGPENIEAEMWRAVAKNLHSFINSHIPCSCTETEEYKEFQRNIDLQPTTGKRLLYAIENRPETEIEEACERCKAMLQYEHRADPIWADHPDRHTIPLNKENN